jgi:hypothetical protein
MLIFDQICIFITFLKSSEVWMKLNVKSDIFRERKT